MIYLSSIGFLDRDLLLDIRLNMDWSLSWKDGGLGWLKPTGWTRERGKHRFSRNDRLVESVWLYSELMLPRRFQAIFWNITYLW